MDPLAEKYPNISPYTYTFQNPINFIDPTGMEGEWYKNGEGNLVAEKGDNEKTLATHLNTSSEIASKMLKEQGYSINNKGILDLKIGDVFEVENTIPVNIFEERIDLGYMGGQIRGRAGSEFSKNLFENYWLGKGDVELSGKRFAGMLMYIKENNPKAGNPIKTNFRDSEGNLLKAGTKKVVSFYSSLEYDKAFGSATLYYNSRGRIIGFYDFYDFDSQPWGQRSNKNEIITRSVNISSPKEAKGFSIRYGYSKR